MVKRREDSGDAGAGSMGKIWERRVMSCVRREREAVRIEVQRVSSERREELDAARASRCWATRSCAAFKRPRRARRASRLEEIPA